MASPPFFYTAHYLAVLFLYLVRFFLVFVVLDRYMTRKWRKKNTNYHSTRGFRIGKNKKTKNSLERIIILNIFTRYIYIISLFLRRILEFIGIHIQYYTTLFATLLYSEKVNDFHLFVAGNFWSLRDYLLKDLCKFFFLVVYIRNRNPRHILFYKKKSPDTRFIFMWFLSFIF